MAVLELESQKINSGNDRGLPGATCLPAPIPWAQRHQCSPLEVVQLIQLRSPNGGRRPSCGSRQAPVAQDDPTTPK